MGESAFLRNLSLLSPEPMVPGSWVLFFFGGGERGQTRVCFMWNMEETEAWTESERRRHRDEAGETGPVELADDVRPWFRQ